MIDTEAAELKALIIQLSHRVKAMEERLAEFDEVEEKTAEDYVKVKQAADNIDSMFSRVNRRLDEVERQIGMIWKCVNKLRGVKR